MDYADIVLAAIVVAYPLAISVLVGVGVSPRVAIAVGSLAASAVILHAIFLNPPRRGRPR